MLRRYLSLGCRRIASWADCRYSSKSISPRPMYFLLSACVYMAWERARDEEGWCCWCWWWCPPPSIPSRPTPRITTAHVRINLFLAIGEGTTPSPRSSEERARILPRYAKVLSRRGGAWARARPQRKALQYVAKGDEGEDENNKVGV